MKIGIISDTHGRLSEHFASVLSSCDYIIHAGDHGTENCYQKIQNLQIPAYMIQGNSDRGRWADALPDRLRFSIDGHLFYLIHNVNDICYGADDDCEFIISGHTHSSQNRKSRGKTYLNPGSATLDRSQMGNSMMLLFLEQNSHQIQMVYDPGI